MGCLDGRVAVITGAGRGLGRAHALLFAREGARVVVNDITDETVGNGDAGLDAPAEDVAAEIRAAGGEAVAECSDVSDWEGARRLVATAVDVFGGLDILVNNAGILRDRLVVNMTEAEWDDVIRVHLRGHFCPTHHAAAYWRDEHKAGRAAPRNVVNTSSTSGLLANPGQSNYGTAKSGIATFTQIVAKELARYDVKANCIAPVARTRLTLGTPGLGDIMAVARRHVRRVGSRQRRPGRRLSGVDGVPLQRRDVLRARRHGATGPLVGARRDGALRGGLGRRRSRRGAGHAVTADPSTA